MSNRTTTRQPSATRSPSLETGSVARRSTEQLTQDAITLVKTGYAGRLPGGKIADRRIHPTAKPIRGSKMLGIPEPKPVHR